MKNKSEISVSLVCTTVGGAVDSLSLTLTLKLSFTEAIKYFLMEV